MLNLLTKFVNWLIAGAGEIIVFLLAIFPTSPFSDPARPPGSIDLGYVTWLIPFPQMIQHFTILLGAIAVYHVIRVAARWVKLVKS